MAEHCWSLRVYYEDTDSMGRVYHANYLKFMERARTEFVREKGWHLDKVAEELGLAFVVKQLQIDYQRAAKFNDQLNIYTKLAKISPASITFEQSIALASSALLVCAALVKVVCIDLKGGTVQRIPPQLSME